MKKYKNGIKGILLTGKLTWLQYLLVWLGKLSLKAHVIKSLSNNMVNLLDSTERKSDKLSKKLRLRSWEINKIIH